MNDKSPLHRRRIRDTLVREKGWRVVSHVDGTIDVRPGSFDNSPIGFGERVRKAVQELGYSPRLVSFSDAEGREHVRLDTPETLGQAGRGAHTR
jgi:hypothetical protein